MVSTYQALGDWRSISRIQEIPNATMTMACNDKGKLLINDEIEFTNDLGQTSIYLGTECTLTFQPNDGCQLTQVLLDGKDITSSIEKNQYVTKFSADTKINVVFTAQSETKRSTAVMNGDINGDVRVKSFRPYLGLGFGRLIPKKRVGFRFELGCQFMGKMRVYQNDSELETNNVVKGKDDLSKWLDKLKVYPVLKFTLTGRIF
jgi:hypothetical protein